MKLLALERRFRDGRGVLRFLDALPFRPAEIVISETEENVCRGLHYQPGLQKAVFVVTGEIVDCALDVHTGELRCVRLEAQKGSGAHIEGHEAHGFYTTLPSVVLYAYSTHYVAETQQRFNPKDFLERIDAVGAVLSKEDWEAKVWCGPQPA